MPRPIRKIVQTEYYYGSESESDGSDEEWVEEMTEAEDDSDSDDTTVILNDEDWKIDEDEDEDEDGSEVSDSEDGTDYESETEPDSDSEELDDPKPYFGKGFRVYFDSHADKKFFMNAFGFRDP